MTISLDLSAVRDGTELTYRAATLDDLDIVIALVIRCDLHDVGEEQADAEDIVSDWQQPSFDLATESVLIFDGARLVAYGEVFKGHRAYGCVHPDERGRGLGSALIRWTWQVARARGRSRVSQPIHLPSDAVALFESYDYRPSYEGWIFELPRGAEMDRPELPPGVSIREFRPGIDDRDAYDVIEDAFSEWANREASSFDDWIATTLRRPGFEPWNLQLAVEDGPDGPEVVGAVNVVWAEGDAWVSKVATRRDRRGLGLGRALLVHALDVARARGGPGVTLGLATDSRTGARDLYERVGMRVKHTYVHYAKDL